MSKAQVKIIVADTYSQLEEKINQWLDEMFSDIYCSIQIHSFTEITNPDRYVIMISYDIDE